MLTEINESYDIIRNYWASKGNCLVTPALFLSIPAIYFSIGQNVLNNSFYTVLGEEILN